MFAGDPDPPARGAWDAVCGFADSREALAARRAEHAAAFAGSPHRLSELPLVEAQYLDRERGRSDGDVVAAAIEEWAGWNSGGLVALPAGAGWTAPGVVRRLARLAGRSRVRPHHAHVWVRDVALEGLSNDWTPVLYEELPYRWGGGADRAVGAVTRRYGLEPEAIAEPVDRDRKAARIARYSSQVPVISPDDRPLDRAETLPQVERYWVLHRPQH